MFNDYITENIVNKNINSTKEVEVIKQSADIIHAISSTEANSNELYLQNIQNVTHDNDNDKDNETQISQSQVKPNEINEDLNVTNNFSSHKNDVNNSNHYCNKEGLIYNTNTNTNSDNNSNSNTNSNSNSNYDQANITFKFADKILYSNDIANSTKSTCIKIKNLYKKVKTKSIKQWNNSTTPQECDITANNIDNTSKLPEIIAILNEKIEKISKKSYKKSINCILKSKKSLINSLYKEILIEIDDEEHINNHYKEENLYDIFRKVLDYYDNFGLNLPWHHFLNKNSPLIKNYCYKKKKMEELEFGSNTISVSVVKESKDKDNKDNKEGYFANKNNKNNNSCSKGEESSIRSNSCNSNDSLNSLSAYDSNNINNINADVNDINNTSSNSIVGSKFKKKSKSFNKHICSNVLIKHNNIRLAIELSNKSITSKSADNGNCNGELLFKDLALNLINKHRYLLRTRRILKSRMIDITKNTITNNVKNTPFRQNTSKDDSFLRFNVSTDYDNLKLHGFNFNTNTNTNNANNSIRLSLDSQFNQYNLFNQFNILNTKSISRVYSNQTNQDYLLSSKRSNKDYFEYHEGDNGNEGNENSMFNDFLQQQNSGLFGENSTLSFLYEKSNMKNVNENVNETNNSKIQDLRNVRNRNINNTKNNNNNNNNNMISKVFHHQDNNTNANANSSSNKVLLVAKKNNNSLNKQIKSENIMSNYNTISVNNKVLSKKNFISSNINRVNHINHINNNKNANINQAALSSLTNTMNINLNNINSNKVKANIQNQLNQKKQENKDTIMNTINNTQYTSNCVQQNSPFIKKFNSRKVFSTTNNNNNLKGEEVNTINTTTNTTNNNNISNKLKSNNLTGLFNKEKDKKERDRITNKQVIRSIPISTNTNTNNYTNYTNNTNTNNYTNNNNNSNNTNSNNKFFSPQEKEKEKRKNISINKEKEFDTIKETSEKASRNFFSSSKKDTKKKKDEIIITSSQLTTLNLNDAFNSVITSNDTINTTSGNNGNNGNNSNNYDNCLNENFISEKFKTIAHTNISNSNTNTQFIVISTSNTNNINNNINFHKSIKMNLSKGNDNVDKVDKNDKSKKGGNGVKGSKANSQSKNNDTIVNHNKSTTNKCSVVIKYGNSSKEKNTNTNNSNVNNANVNNNNKVSIVKTESKKLIKPPTTRSYNSNNISPNKLIEISKKTNEKEKVKSQNNANEKYTTNNTTTVSTIPKELIDNNTTTATSNTSNTNDNNDISANTKRRANPSFSQKLNGVDLKIRFEKESVTESHRSGSISSKKSNTKNKHNTNTNNTNNTNELFNSNKLKNDKEIKKIKGNNNITYTTNTTNTTNIINTVEEKDKTNFVINEEKDDELLISSTISKNLQKKFEKINIKKKLNTNFNSVNTTNPNKHSTSSNLFGVNNSTSNNNNNNSNHHHLSTVNASLHNIHNINDNNDKSKKVDNTKRKNSANNTINTNNSNKATNNNNVKENKDNITNNNMNNNTKTLTLKHNSCNASNFSKFINKEKEKKLTENNNTNNANNNNKIFNKVKPLFKEEKNTEMTVNDLELNEIKINSSINYHTVHTTQEDLNSFIITKNKFEENLITETNNNNEEQVENTYTTPNRDILVTENNNALSTVSPFNHKDIKPPLYSTTSNNNKNKNKSNSIIKKKSCLIPVKTNRNITENNNKISENAILDEKNDEIQKKIIITSENFIEKSENIEKIDNTSKNNLIKVSKISKREFSSSSNANRKNKGNSKLFGSFTSTKSKK